MSRARQRRGLALPVWFQRLNAGRASSDVFRQARHGFSAMRFVLDTLEANEGIRAGFTATGSLGASGEGVKPHGRRSIATMGESDFDAIREVRKLDLQMGAL